MMVSFDTNALIAACQGAAWKISGWPDNITIHHAKGCACCHEYINHLLGAQSFIVRFILFLFNIRLGSFVCILNEFFTMCEVYVHVTKHSARVH